MDILTRLEPIVGYYQLRMFAEASEEIECLPPELKTRPVTLSLRTSIYRELGEWQLMREMAENLVRIDPENTEHRIDLAYATRRCRSIAEAETILLEALKLDPENALIHFNLACYATQQGNLEEARNLLATAISLEAEFKELALTDPDLEPLRLPTGRFPDLEP